MRMPAVEQVHEALESTTPMKARSHFGDGRAVATTREILCHRAYLLHFLTELEDNDMSVAELVEALNQYD